MNATPTLRDLKEGFVKYFSNPTNESSYAYNEAAFDRAVQTFEADLREWIAKGIEGLKVTPNENSPTHCIDEYNAGIANAAKIARGE